MAEVSGQKISIIVEAIDKASAQLKQVKAGLGGFEKTAVQTSEGVAKSSQKMSKEIDLFETNSNKAVKKAVKSFANFGGFFGNVAEDFSLGAGLIAGAVGFAVAKSISQIKENNDALLSWSKTARETGLEFAGIFGELARKSDELNKVTASIKALEEATKALNAGAGVGILDKLLGRGSLQEVERARSESFVSTRTSTILQKQGFGAYNAASQSQIETARAEAEAELAAANAAKLHNARLLEEAQLLLSNEKLAHQQAFVEYAAQEQLRARTRLTEGETQDSMSLAQALVELSKRKVRSADDAVRLAVDTQKLGVELEKASPAMRSATAALRDFYMNLAATTIGGKGKLMDVGYSPAAK